LSVVTLWALTAQLREAEAEGDVVRAKAIREKIERERRKIEELKREMKAEKEAKVRRLIDEIAELKENRDYVNMARKVAKLAQIDPEALDREELWP
jgi:acetyl-CoA carboxylase carboxyltransferase component